MDFVPNLSTQRGECQSVTFDPANAAKCASVVTGWKRPLIITHARPDGDAIGSVIAMRCFLRSVGADPLAIVFDPVPARYAFLVEDEPLAVFDEKRMGDLDNVDSIVVVDTCTYNQISPIADWLKARTGEGGLPVLAVDHHVTRDPLADHYVVDETASAACAIIFEWAKVAGWELDATARTAIFVGTATDTGWFRFANTDVRTLEIATELVRQGVVPNEVYNRLYQSESAARLKLWAAALNGMELHDEDKIAVLTVTNAMFADTQADQADTEDLINESLRIATVETAVLLTETPDGPVKASFRSKGKMNVAELAKHFGGGGHKLASGARFNQPINEAKSRILQRIMTHRS
jgi:bifunctional oligoribonuclease and PAP phosphatase NrnA